MTIDELEKDITLQQGLLRQYEEQLSYTTDPRKRQEINAEIRRAKIFILGLQAQLAQLHRTAETTPAANSIETTQPEPELPAKPEIINRLNPYEEIPSYAEAILKLMFATENQITVTQRFGRGLSGSLVYIVQPGNQLPNVVKIDYHEKMMQEWQAFTKYISNRMPNAVLGQGEPVRLSESDYAGLRYPLAGYGVFKVAGLYDYFRERSVEEGKAVLSRLFLVMSVLYRSRQQQQFWPQTIYDNALPQNLVIDCGRPTDYGRPFAPKDVRAIQFNQNDPIKVSAKWQVAEYLRSQNGLELRHPSQSYGFRMQLINVENFKSYEIGQPLGEALNGTVSQTRASIFAAALAETVGGIDPNASNLHIFFNYPNPLYYLKDILNESINGFAAPVHGDLNLENVIVDTSNGNPNIIDFAKSRPDHIIRDFLHLEMNLVTTLLTEAASTDGYDRAKIKDFYERLHVATTGQRVDPPAAFAKVFELILTIRNGAINALVDRNNWREYEQALFIYLLGALRYAKVAKNPALHILGKQTAFYAAATLLNILQGKFDPQTLTPSTAPTSTDTSNTSSTSATNTRPTKTTSTPTNPPYPVTEMPLSRMREVIISTFSENELRDFVFDLDDPEADAERFGRYKSEIARELIDFYRRRNMLPELQQALFDARPSSDWWGKK